jgi:hypothetical protein
MINIVTSAEVAASAAERWRANYQRTGTWTPTISGDSEETYKRILAANGDPQGIADAIGNKLWSFVTCSACGNDLHIVVEYTGKWGSGDNDARLCQNCLAAGLAALEAVKRVLK